MAFDVYFAAHRARSQARGGLARLAVDVALAIVLALLATQQLLRFSVTRVEPPPLPPERSLEPPEIPMVEIRSGCTGWPMSGDDEVGEIPEEVVVE